MRTSISKLYIKMTMCVCINSLHICVCELCRVTPFVNERKQCRFSRKRKDRSQDGPGEHLLFANQVQKMFVRFKNNVLYKNIESF